MAMNSLYSFWNYKLRVAVIACSALLLTVTATQAGFEWTPAEPEMAPQPAPVVESNSAMPSESLLSPLPPLPGEEPEPVAAEEPVIKRKVMTPQPMESAEPKREVVKFEPAATPAPAPQTRNTITTSPLMPSEQEVLYEDPSMVKTNTASEQDVIVKTRVVMPEDAPSTVPDTLADEETKLRIDPNPPQAPSAEISTDVPDTEVVGFGSDMPLALALQQIAPAGYAFSFGENINPGAKVSWTGGKPWTVVMDEMIAPLELEARITGKAILIRNKNMSALPAAENESENLAAIEDDASNVLRFEPAAGPEISAEEPLSVNSDDLKRASIQDPGDLTVPPQNIVVANAEPLPVTKAEETNAAAEMKAEEKPVLRNDAPKAQMRVWEAAKGDSLKQTLDQWSKTSGMDVEWNASHDYMLESDVMVSGKIEKAIKSLMMNGLNPESGPTLTYAGANGDANAKLIIEDQS